MGRSPLAIVAPYPFAPARSGGHKAVSAYVRYLSAAWPTICISTTNNAELEGVEQVPLFDDRPSKYFDPRVGWRIRRLLQKRQVRYLGLQHHYHGLLLRPFLLGLDIDVFIFSHNIEFERWRSIGKWWWPAMKWTERSVYRWADAVFFISCHEQQRAPKLFGLKPQNCHYAPYPIDQAKSPPFTLDNRNTIVDRHGFKSNDKLLLFFGPQTYPPNLQAVEDIVFRIHPQLQAKNTDSYRILICGGGLPERYQKFTDKQSEGIHYLGFVEDIETYIQAADIILNPVNIGGGVKTKLVEAIALGRTVISSKTGAFGIRETAFGDKLITIPDTDWPGFAKAISSVLAAADKPTPSTFYDEHYGPMAIKSILKWMQTIRRSDQIF